MISIVYYSLISGLVAAVISMGYPKVHKAKGQEYDRVYIDPEGVASFSIPGGRRSANLETSPTSPIWPSPERGKIQP